MKITGLDLSMSASGLARNDGSTLTVKPRGDGDYRLVDIVGQLAAEMKADRPELVVMEDLTSMLKANAAKAIGMVHGAVRFWLIEDGIPYVVMSPSTLKKYATGRGTADKSAMILAAYKRSGVEYTDNDQCDAAWLRWAGLDHYGEAVFPLPHGQRDALRVVPWPTR